jgi:nicotinamidase-related amidase
MKLGIGTINQDILEYAKNLEGKPSLKLSELDPNHTVLVVVDVINGFAKEGALASSRVGEIVPNVKRLMQMATANDIKTVAFADCHNENSIEFESFTPHCLENTSESKLVDEIQTLEYTLINKNSTNGFHAPNFQKFLAENPNLDSFIVCGDCTDICVLNFCLTLKTYFNQMDKPCKIVVPMDCVETYDAPSHSAELMNLASFKLMENSGIAIVSTVV